MRSSFFRRAIFPAGLTTASSPTATAPSQGRVHTFVYGGKGFQSDTVTLLCETIVLKALRGGAVYVPPH